MFEVLVGASLRRVPLTASIQVWAPLVKVSRVLRFYWGRESEGFQKSWINLREGSRERRAHRGKERE